VTKKLLSTDFTKGMPSAHELARIKKYIIKNYFSAPPAYIWQGQVSASVIYLL
jgi:hypothetical protein